MIRTSTTLVLLFALLFAGAAHAQYTYNGPGSRGPASLEISYYYPITGATYSYTATDYDAKSGKLTDTSFSKHINNKGGGFGAFIGYSIPVAKMGDNSRLAIAFGFMYGVALWESGSFSYQSSSQTGTTTEGSGSADIGVPIGLDYKFGADALRDKSQRFCATIGMGVYPSFTLTAYNGDAQAKSHVLPYIKGEVGIFAGICMKLRAQFNFGDIKYIDYGSETNYGSSHTSLKGKSSLSLGLVLMPFSWKWNRSQWWGRRR